MSGFRDVPIVPIRCVTTLACVASLAGCGSAPSANAADASPSVRRVTQADARIATARSPRERAVAVGDAVRRFDDLTRPYGTSDTARLRGLLGAAANDDDARAALNASFRRNAFAIVAASVASSGRGLRPSGREVVRGYARMLFAADGRADARAASEADANLRRLFDALLADIVAARHDRGVRLTSDFGAGTFGRGAERDGNAAQTLGDLSATVRTAAGDLLKPVMEPSDAQVSAQRRRIDALDDRARSAGLTLAHDRPNEGLANRFDDGRTAGT